MKAKDFDKKFDRGESVLSQLDLSKATRPGQEQRIGPMGVMGRMTTIVEVGWDEERVPPLAGKPLGGGK